MAYTVLLSSPPALSPLLSSTTASSSFPVRPKSPFTSTRRRRVSLISRQFLTFSSLPCDAATLGKRRGRGRICSPIASYISAPAPDFVVEGDSEVYFSSLESSTVVNALSWGVIWPLLLRHKVRIVVAFAALVGCTTCTLSMPIFSGKFFEILVGRRSETILDILSKIGLVYFLEPICTVIFVLNMTTVWEKVMASLRSQIFRRMLIQKVEFFDRYKVGELTGILTSDLGALKDVVSDNISRDRGLRAFSEVVGTICILFTLSPQLAPILASLMLSISILVALFRRSTVPVFKLHGLVQAKISDCLTEAFSAIRTVRSFAGEKHQMSMFGNLVLDFQRSGVKLGVLKSLIESLTRVAIYISLISLYFLGGSKVKAGELAVGTMASFVGYTFTLTFAVQGGINTISDLRGMFAAVKRINSILSATEIDDSLAHSLKLSKGMTNKELCELYEVDSSQKHQLTSTRRLKSVKDWCSLAWSGDICLEDVSFSYPLRSDVKVLNGLNLTLKRGEVTALVGPSGAGKSTIVQLLAHFYVPTKGRITVAGEDVRTFDKREWARIVAIVNQEPVLFSVSVGENIAYGLPDEDVSREDVIKAAKAANAHEFILSLPQGYDTLVGERGSLLSGGQRQRIAIARALLKDAPILILDEATSALDAVSERLVQQALEHLMSGRTTLVIAHRLSTVQSANRIAVCSGGTVAELGTHAELLARNGLYASLVGTQRLAFE